MRSEIMKRVYSTIVNRNAVNGRDPLGEEIGDADQEQNQGGDAQTDRESRCRRSAR